MKRGLILFLVVVLRLSALTADNGSTAEAERPRVHGDVLVHAGMIGIVDREAVDNFVSLEARLRRDWHQLRPWAGLTLVDSGAWFSGAGLIYDIRLSPSARLTLGSGPFYYTHGEEDDDLGFSLEFYSFVEASWVWKGERRIGVRFGHLSNAGLGRRNPGTETLSLVISLPLGPRFAASER